MMKTLVSILLCLLMVNSGVVYSQQDSTDRKIEFHVKVDL